MMVLLGFYASVVAIVGGAVVGDLTLGIPFWTFLDRIHDVVPEHDLWVGLIKAPVFGLIVALAGCYNGLQVRGNSEEVGRRTTMAVVSAIFCGDSCSTPFLRCSSPRIGWGVMTGTPSILRMIRPPESWSKGWPIASAISWCTKIST